MTMDPVFFIGCHWVAINAYGWYEIYREATRVCLIGYAGDKGFALACWYAGKLEAREVY